MPRAVPLDKILTQGTTYTTHEREAWIIKKLGTNSSTRGYVKIDGKETTYIHTTAAPVHKTSSNLLGPINLGNLYLVVPPETDISWEGASGSILRVVGTKLILSPGESLEASLMDRFNRQPNEYIYVIEDSYSHGTDTAWTAGDENEVVSLTPKTIEKYVLDSVVMADISNTASAVSEGQFVITFYLDNNPLENITGDNINAGIDVLSMPRPPADSTEEMPFSLESFPIAVEGDHTLSIRCKNVSGSDISPTSGTSITVTVTAVAKFFRKP